MGLNNIKEHDHNTSQVSQQTHSELGGMIVKERCADPDCDYWFSEWQQNEQSSLGEF